jgi:hypothetical protein
LHAAVSKRGASQAAMRVGRLESTWKFVNQFRLVLGDGPEGNVTGMRRRAIKAPSRIVGSNMTTRDFGGDLSCAFY